MCARRLVFLQSTRTKTALYQFEHDIFILLTVISLLVEVTVTKGLDFACRERSRTASVTVVRACSSAFYQS